MFGGWKIENFKSFILWNPWCSLKQRKYRNWDSVSNLYVYFNIEIVSTCSIRCNLSWHVRTGNIEISLHINSLISLSFPPEEMLGLWLPIECLSKTQCITRRHLSVRWAHMPTCNFSYADAQSDLSLRWAHIPTCTFCCAMRSLIWVFDRRICRLVT